MNLSFKILLLFFAFHITLLEGSVLAPFGKVHVRLTNILGPGSSLTIHCQSKDDDLGVHVLSNNNYFEWTFHPNFFNLSTLFFCKIQWQGKEMSYDSYLETRDLFGCHKRCFWDINSMGACLVNFDEGGYDRCFNWPKAKILGTKQQFEKEMP